MDAANKFLDTDGLEYFIGATDPIIIKSADELTDPDFPNENNIIVAWGGGLMLKCIAPIEIGYDTRFLYIGVGAYYNEPTSITTGTNTQTIVYGSSDYTLVRTRSSSSDPWPNRINIVNGVTTLNEETTRAGSVEVVKWYRTDTNELVGDGVWGSGDAGSLSPGAMITANQRPVYGQYNN